MYMLLDCSLFTFRDGQEAVLMHVHLVHSVFSTITLFHLQHFVDKQTVVNRHSQDAILNCDTTRDKLAALDLCQQYLRFIFVWSVQYSLSGGAGSRFVVKKKQCKTMTSSGDMCTAP